MNRSFELYKIFYYTALQGNITEAARRLFLSQPAVSQSIKQLEEGLQTRLFYRRQRGVNLTDEGKALFEYVEKAINLIDAGENHLGEIQQLHRGNIHIGAADTLCKHYLIPYLEAFKRDFPGVSIHITNRTSRETIRLLKRGRVDFGLINTPINDPTLTIIPVRTIHDCFAASSHFTHLRNRRVSLEEISRSPLLMLEPMALSRELVNHFFQERGITLKPEIELGSIDLITAFALSDLGIACTCREFISKELEEKALFEIEMEEDFPERAIGIVRRKGQPVPSAADRFIERFLLEDSPNAPNSP